MTHRTGYKKMGFILILTLLSIIILPSLFHFTVAESMLNSSSIVNYNMRILTMRKDPEHIGEFSEIKAIRMADSLPAGFIPDATNTVSAPDSSRPIYIFFDNENEAGIMYFYTDDNTITMNPNSSYMFANMESLTDISGIAGWDSSKVTSFRGLFLGVSKLSDALALKNWDTSNVTDMSYMFSSAASLKFIDVSNWDTGKVTNMTCMFQVGGNHAGDGQLTEINGLGDLDVTNVRDMTCMFYGAGQMTFYDVSRWDVSKVESMNHMFCDNYKLVSLDLSKWDVSNVKTMYCMFDDCQALKTIGDVSHWNTVSLVDAGAWINDARSFVGNNEGLLDLSGWNTTNLKAAGEMFLNTKIHTIDLSGWTFDSITNEKWEGAGQGIYYETGNGPEHLRGLGQMFKGTKNLTAVYVSQSGLDSFNAAVEREVNTLDMWTDSKTDSFTVK